MGPHEMHEQETAELQVIEFDLEELSKAGKTPPSHEAHHEYKIRIDKHHFTVKTPIITGRELLTMAGKQPVERYRIYQKLRGGSLDPIDLDQSVDLTTPGVERFKTLPLDQTEG